MNVLLIMVPLAMFFIFGFLVFFIWAVKDGQFDDINTPAHRILFNEDEGSNND